MIVGKVVGRTWATARHPSLHPLRMLLVKHYDPTTKKTSGIPYMALDKNINAGVGDMVLMVDDGGPSRMILEDDAAPVRGIIIGIVDDVFIDESFQRFETAEPGSNS
ncbi:MAG: EutN/CcmL family microcompartment protein [bacterium]